MNTQEENRKLLELYAPLRVADVRDGMDWLGYHHYGSLAPDIRPLWRTRACGIARTARYLPYEGPAPLFRRDAYTEWSNTYYNTVATYPWMEKIEEGDFIVLDMSGVDVGLMGSDNTLTCLKREPMASSPTAAVSVIRMNAFFRRFLYGAGLFPRRWIRQGYVSVRWTFP